LGSVFVYDVENKAKVLELLQKDPYYHNGVWDVENGLQIYAFDRRI